MHLTCEGYVKARGGGGRGEERAVPIYIKPMKDEGKREEGLHLEGRGDSLLGLCVMKEVARLDVTVNDVQLMDTPQCYQQVLHVVTHIAHIKCVEIVLKQTAWN